MSTATVDQFGVWRIPLPEEDSLNAPGSIEVDGDLFEAGPCATLRFKLASDFVGGEQEVDFGSFCLKLSAAGTFEGSCILTTAAAHDLIAALESQVGPRPASVLRPPTAGKGET